MIKVSIFKILYVDIQVLLYKQKATRGIGRRTKAIPPFHQPNAFHKAPTSNCFSFSICPSFRAGHTTMPAIERSHPSQTPSSIPCTACYKQIISLQSLVLYFMVTNHSALEQCPSTLLLLLATSPPEHHFVPPLRDPHYH